MSWLGKLLRRDKESMASNRDKQCKFCSIHLSDSESAVLYKRCSEIGMSWESFVKSSLDIMLGVVNDEYVLVRGPSHPEYESEPRELSRALKGRPELKLIKGGKP
jgi:hypothetical protein